MHVRDLKDGMLLKVRPGMWLGWHMPPAFPRQRFKYITVNGKSTWNSIRGEVCGDGEIIIYLGDRIVPLEGKTMFNPKLMAAHAAAGKIREVFWRGEIYRVRPSSWRWFEPLEQEENILDLSALKGCSFHLE